MDDAPRRRSGGRAARQAARLLAHAEHVPFLTRTLAPFEVLGEEGLSLIEENADTVLQEVGLEFRGNDDALRLFREAGADVTGTRVRFPRGLARSIIQASAPRQFTQYARNPERNVEIGGMHTVLAPNYGSPFVRDLDRGRRYGTIEDFRNLVKLTYLSPHLHHSGGTVCEPVDVPVNKRHLDMVYAHMRYSDKPFMGSVTAPERARDTVEMARILFGAPYLEDHTVILSLINANSPLVWDGVMLGAAQAYAEANQATLLTPFILAGAMSPVTVAATATQTLAEAMGGMAFVQLVRPGRTGRPRLLRQLDLDAVGRADVRHAGAVTGPVRDGLAGAPARGAVPLRREPVRLEDRRRPGRLRVGGDLQRDDPRGRQLRPACRRLARGRAHRRLREVHPRQRPVRDGRGLRQRRGPVRERPGPRRDPEQRAGPALPRQRPHPRQLRARLLSLRDRRQQQLRAVAGGRLARRRAAGQRHLEADARRVRGATRWTTPRTRRSSSSSSSARPRCRTRRSDRAWRPRVADRCSSVVTAACRPGNAGRSRASSSPRRSSSCRSRTPPRRPPPCRPVPPSR